MIDPRVSEVSYERYKELLVEELSERMGQDYLFYYREVPEINGGLNETLVIKKEGVKASPCIRVDRLYTQFCDGEMDISRIADHIVALYREDRSLGISLSDRFWESRESRSRSI